MLPVSSLPNGFYCGTSNIVLPVSNKQYFPPEYQNKSRLNYYGSLLNSVEVNSTFYKLPMARTVEKWAADVPAHFRFSFKLWREITHARDLLYDPDKIRKFMEIVRYAGEQKGCLLVQFPASIKISFFQKLRQLFEELLNTGLLTGWKLAVEFRDKSWYQDHVYQILEYYQVAVVIHDMSGAATPPIDMECDIVYMRFHGIEGDYRGDYTDQFLSGQAGWIRSRLDEGKQVYVYFNNTIGSAIQNAMTLDLLIRNSHNNDATK